MKRPWMEGVRNPVLRGGILAMVISHLLTRMIVPDPKSEMSSWWWRLHRGPSQQKDLPRKSTINQAAKIAKDLKDKLWLFYVVLILHGYLKIYASFSSNFLAKKKYCLDVKGLTSQQWTFTREVWLSESKHEWTALKIGLNGPKKGNFMSPKLGESLARWAPSSYKWSQKGVISTQL